MAAKRLGNTLFADFGTGNSLRDVCPMKPEYSKGVANPRFISLDFILEPEGVLTLKSYPARLRENNGEYESNEANANRNLSCPLPFAIFPEGLE